MYATSTTLLTTLTAGCIFGSSQKRGVTDIIIKNSTDSKKEATINLSDCSISDNRQQLVTVEPGNSRKLNNVVVMNSGICKLNLKITGRDEMTYSWEVNRSILNIVIKNNDVEFKLS